MSGKDVTIAAPGREEEARYGDSIELNGRRKRAVLGRGETQNEYIADNAQMAGRRGDGALGGERIRCDICLILESGEADHLSAPFAGSGQSHQHTLCAPLP